MWVLTKSSHICIHIFVVMCLLSPQYSLRKDTVTAVIPVIHSQSKAYKLPVIIQTTDNNSKRTISTVNGKALIHVILKQQVERLFST